MNFYLRIFVLSILLVVCVVLAYSQAPPAPENLTVQKGLLGGAILNWDTSSGAVGYIIYKSIDGSHFGRAGATHRHGFVDWWVFPDLLYRYYVTAFNMVGMTMEESGPSDTVQFAIGLHHSPLPGQGVIGGKIVDDLTQAPLKGAVVRFFSPGKLFAEKTHTDSGGVYWAALDSGRYLVRADKFDYFGEWFDDVYRVENATVINLHADSLAVANFALRHVPVPVPVTVSGRVTDTLTGNPLQNAFVAFLRPHRWLRELQVVTGLFGGFMNECTDISGLGRLFGVVWVGRTDQDGYYTAHLIKDLKYIALAFKPGYIPEFYDNKYTPFGADRLRFSQDTSGIDFKLLNNPLAIHSMYGSVVDSAGMGIPSNVIVYRKTIYGRLPVRFVMTDSLGNFECHYLVSGIFYIKAFPIDAYAPAWFSKIDCGVRNWRFADTLQVSGDVEGIEICVEPAPRLGFARIAGNIDSNPGNLFLAAPEQGVTAYAVSTATNQIMGYDVTEDDGTYAIENLPEGTYSIVVDKEGFYSASTPVVTVDESNNYEVSDASLTLDPEPSSVDDDNNSLPLVYKLYQNYPNPFNPTTQIQFDLPKASRVTLKIFNVIGQQVAVLINTIMEPGTHTARWNAKEAGTGIYFVKIVATPVNGNGTSFNQVRKMILMK